MKISNITILNTDLTNNTAKISFTISETTENVNVYLKINDEEYKAIFFNKTNGNLEYIANVSRGVNNLLLKATDSTTEYISEPIQVLLKETPSIKNLECSYSDSTGKYILNFAFNGDANFKYNIYLKLDNNDYIEVLSNQISGDKTIEQTSTMGEHTCILKVSDGYNDYTFSPFQFEIANHKPVLSKVLVTDITNNGEAYIYYSTKDIESSTLTHKLAIGTTETVIAPTQVDNFYSYKVTGLSEGISNCMISISDGLDTVSSDVFSIEVFSNTTDKKELLRRAKVRYDSAYQQLRDIIVSVISDLKCDYDIENALIAKAQDNYKIEYSNFNKISQQSIDTIGTNKVNVTRQDLETQINDVDNAVDTLETTMNGVFKDGILDESEKKILEENLNLVAKEKADVDRDYETLYNNEDLLDPAKTKLQTKYNDFTTTHTALVTTVNNIINKTGIIDNTDKSNIDTAFENWRVALGDYRNASLEAIDSIAKKKADDSADVVDKKWAEIILDPDTGIQAQVGNLSTTVNGFDQRITNVEITADGVSSTVSSIQSTVDGFDNRITTAESNITQLSDKITSTVMTTDDVKSVIEQSPSSIRIGFNGISDNVVIDSSGLTVNRGAIACDQLCTPSGHSPVINLFTRDEYSCQIDARKSDGGDFGTALRLKYDNYNYYYVSDNSIQFYQNGIGTFGFKNNSGSSEISTTNGWLIFEGHRITFKESDDDEHYLSFTDDEIGRLDNGNTYVICQSDEVQVSATYGITVNGTSVSLEGHSHSGYASSDHGHDEYAPSDHSHSSISYGSSTSVDCYSGSLYLDCSSIYLQGYTQVSGSLDPSSTGIYNLGYGEKKWQQVVAKDVYADYCSGSDIKIKENIHYIKTNNTSMFSTGDTDETLKENTENNVNLGITNEDLYLFIKDELKLCEYNYTDEYIANGTRGNLEGKLGFIAQDIVDSKVGSLIVGDWEGQLTYNLNNYVSSLGGAIQYEIALRDAQIADLEDRIVELENKLNK